MTKHNHEQFCKQSMQVNSGAFSSHSSRPVTQPSLMLFDLDGTLMSTGGAGLRALEKTFLELYGISTLRTAVDPSGKTDPAIFREVIRTFLLREAKADEMLTITETYLQFLKVEMSLAVEVRVYEGVREMLEVLRSQQHVLVALGTGNVERGARLKLEPVGLNPYFSFGGFGSDAENRADVLKTAHRRGEQKLNDKIPASRTYVIGDTPRDVVAARQAGFRSIAVATGNYPLDVLKREKPDFLLNTLSEGLELVFSL